MGSILDSASMRRVTVCGRRFVEPQDFIRSLARRGSDRLARSEA